MTNVNIDDELYKQVAAFVEKNKIDYPTLQNFCNKAVKNQLRIDMIQEKENKR